MFTNCNSVRVVDTPFSYKGGKMKEMGHKSQQVTMFRTLGNGNWPGCGPYHDIIFSISSCQKFMKICTRKTKNFIFIYLKRKEEEKTCAQTMTNQSEKIVTDRTYKAAWVEEDFQQESDDQKVCNQCPEQAISFLHGMDCEVLSTIQQKPERHL